MFHWQFHRWLTVILLWPKLSSLHELAGQPPYLINSHNLTCTREMKSLLRMAFCNEAAEWLFHCRHIIELLGSSCNTYWDNYDEQFNLSIYLVAKDGLRLRSQGEVLYALGVPHLKQCFAGRSSPNSPEPGRLCWSLSGEGVPHYHWLIRAVGSKIQPVRPILTER